MGLIAVFLIALSLAMDALAVSISNGIAAKTFRKRDSLKVAVYFGTFQFIMPVIGYMLAAGFEDVIKSFDHWIAFVLLSVIGVNMILEGRKAEESCEKVNEPLDIKKLILQAIATSIDALAVGISFAVVKDENIILNSLIIGLVALVLSYIGGIFGKKMGCVFRKSANNIGGIILVCIGVKILIEHIFFS